MKTLKLSVLFIGLLTLTALNACTFDCVKGSGNEASEDRKAEAYTQIDASGAYKITLKQDSSLSIHIIGDDNLLKYIKTTVDGDQLRITTKRSICTQKDIRIVLGVRNLETIKAAGAVEITSDGKLNVKDLDINLSGACKLNLDLNAANVTTKGSGSTDISLKGQATSHTIKLTGSGKVSALDFVVNKYNVETTGAGEYKINVLNDLSVHATGASDIQYRGNPTTINNSKSGSSTIKKID